MPANLPPQYFDVEKKYREARDPNEKLVYLQQLLSIIPKHKGTEKLQAELKTKISKTRDAIDKQKKAKGGGGSWYQVEKQGAGQIVLVGLPSSGKSTILNYLTNARVDVGEYPFTTKLPQVGMIAYENIKIQLVDTPPLYADAPPWLYGLYRNADVLLIVLDSTGEIEEDFAAIVNLLHERNVFIEKQDFGDVKQALVVLNKIEDIDEVAPFKPFIETHKKCCEVLPFLLHDRNSGDVLKKKIFCVLKIIRVYTKKVGKPIVRDDPVVLREGATVLDAAEHIHKDFKKNLKFARLWNDGDYQGQRVEKHHVLVDGDVLEFHV